MTERVEFLEPKVEVRTGIAVTGPRGAKGDPGDPGQDADTAALETAIADIAADVLVLDGELDTKADASALAGKASAAGLAQEITDRTAADSSLATSVSTEITNRTNADATLQSDINTRATSAALTSGLAAKADASAMTTALAGKVDTSTYTTGLATKADASATTTALAGKASTTALSTEITDRTNADSALQTDINTRATTAALTSGLAGKATTTALAQEITDRTNADALKADAAATTSALAGKASTGSVTTVANNLAQEITDRTNAVALKVDSSALPALIDSRVMPPKTEVLWTESTDLNRFSVVVHSLDTVSAWDKSIVTYGNADAGVGEGGYANRARFQGPAGAGGGNTRLLYVFDEVTCKNCEVRLTAMDHSGVGSNNSQIGIIIGYDATTGKAIVVWHDIFVSNPRTWNFGLWRIASPPGNPGAASVTSASGNKNWAFRPVLDPPFRYEILDSWRISGVAYYRLVTRDHGIVVGNLVHVVGTGLDTFGAATVTSVNGSIITFAYAGVDTANTGPGYMQQGTDPSPFPISIAVKRQDNWVLGKFWNTSEPEPIWSDQRYVARWSLAFTDPTIGAPPTFGKTGFCINHMTTGKFAEISNFSVEPQDRKP